MGSRAFVIELTLEGIAPEWMCRTPDLANLVERAIEGAEGVRRLRLMGLVRCPYAVYGTVESDPEVLAEAIRRDVPGWMRAKAEGGKPPALTVSLHVGEAAFTKVGDALWDAQGVFSLMREFFVTMHREVEESGEGSQLDASPIALMNTVCGLFDNNYAMRMPEGIFREESKEVARADTKKRKKKKKKKAATDEKDGGSEERSP